MLAEAGRACHPTASPFHSDESCIEQIVFTSGNVQRFLGLPPRDKTPEQRFFTGRGKRAAALMSLVASCKHNCVEPWAYLKDVLTRLAGQPHSADLERMLPNAWLADHPTHRWTIHDQRQAERAPKRS